MEVDEVGIMLAFCCEELISVCHWEAP